MPYILYSKKYEYANNVLDKNKYYLFMNRSYTKRNIVEVDDSVDDNTWSYLNFDMVMYDEDYNKYTTAKHHIHDSHLEMSYQWDLYRRKIRYCMKKFEKGKKEIEKREIKKILLHCICNDVINIIVEFL